MGMGGAVIRPGWRWATRSEGRRLGGQQAGRGQGALHRAQQPGPGQAGRRRAVCATRKQGL